MRSCLALATLLAAGSTMADEVILERGPRPPSTAAFTSINGLGAEVKIKPINTDMVFLLIDKKNLRADLMTWPEKTDEAALLMSFQIAVGKAVGDKQKQGDNKTPEGIYITQGFIPGNTLPPRYGAMAIPINFPNPVDRYMGKTGYGIWLHGVENKGRIAEKQVTRGCVAFYNKDIKQLANWVRAHQTVVMIVNGKGTVNSSHDLGRVRQLTAAWQTAWQSRDIVRYSDFYSANFRHKAMGKNAYRAHKKAVFAAYTNMSVAMDNHRYFSNGRYAIAVMNQDFNGDNRYVAKGRKILYWEKTPTGDWKILREIYENRRLTFLTFKGSDAKEQFKDSPSAKLFKISDKTWN